MKHLFSPPLPPHTAGPCAVQNPTASSTSRGKLGTAHLAKRGWGQISDFSLLYAHPVTTKILRAVKKEIKC